MSCCQTSGRSASSTAPEPARPRDPEANPARRADERSPTSSRRRPSIGYLHRARARAVAKVVGVALVLGLGVEHAAFAYAGEQLLQFAANYIIAPLALFMIVAAIVASFVRPEFVKGAFYIALGAAFVFFIIKQAGSIMSAMQS